MRPCSSHGLLTKRHLSRGGYISRDARKLKRYFKNSMTGDDKEMSTFCACFRHLPVGKSLFYFPHNAVWHYFVLEKTKHYQRSCQSSGAWILITDRLKIISYQPFTSFDLFTKKSQLGYTSFLIHQALCNETMKRLTMQCIKDSLQRESIFQFSGAVRWCR